MGSYKMKMLSKIGYEYEKKDNLIRENYIHKDKIEIAWNPKQLKLPRTKVRKGNSAFREKESKLKKVLQSMQKGLSPTSTRSHCSREKDISIRFSFQKADTYSVELIQELASFSYEDLGSNIL